MAGLDQAGEMAMTGPRGELVPGSYLTLTRGNTIVLTVLPQTEDAKKKQYCISREAARRVLFEEKRVDLHKFDEQTGLLGYDRPNVDKNHGYVVLHERRKTVVFGVQFGWGDKNEAIIIKHYIKVLDFKGVAGGHDASAQGTIWIKGDRNG